MRESTELLEKIMRGRRWALDMKEVQKYIGELGGADAQSDEYYIWMHKFDDGGKWSTETIILVTNRTRVLIFQRWVDYEEHVELVYEEPILQEDSLPPHLNSFTLSYIFTMKIEKGRLITDENYLPTPKKVSDVTQETICKYLNMPELYEHICKVRDALRFEKFVDRRPIDDYIRKCVEHRINYIGLDGSDGTHGSDNILYPDEYYVVCKESETKCDDKWAPDLILLITNLSRIILFYKWYTRGYPSKLAYEEPLSEDSCLLTDSAIRHLNNAEYTADDSVCVSIPVEAIVKEYLLDRSIFLRLQQCKLFK